MYQSTSEHTKMPDMSQLSTTPPTNVQNPSCLIMADSPSISVQGEPGMGYSLSTCTYLPDASSVSRSAVRTQSGSGDPETFLQSPSNIGLHHRFKRAALDKARACQPHDLGGLDNSETVCSLMEQLAKKRTSEMLMQSYVNSLAQRTAMRRRCQSKDMGAHKRRVAANGNQFTSKYAEALGAIQPHLTLQMPVRRRTLVCGELSAWHQAVSPPIVQELAAYSAFCDA